jgi:hypothetical protein
MPVATSQNQVRLKLKDLTHVGGIDTLVRVTGGTRSFYNQPERAQAVMQVAQDAITRNPSIAHTVVRIVPNLNNAFYNYDHNEFILGITNPDVLAHELAHADNLRQATLYQKVLSAANGITRLNHVAALPTVLALRAFIKDPDRRKDILKTLSALSAAASAPIIAEEMSASMQALLQSPDKLQALKTLGPALGTHMLTHMLPSTTYDIGSKV